MKPADAGLQNSMDWKNLLWMLYHMWVEKILQRQSVGCWWYHSICNGRWEEKCNPCS